MKTCIDDFYIYIYIDTHTTVHLRPPNKKIKNSWKNIVSKASKTCHKKKSIVSHDGAWCRFFTSKDV